MNATPDTLRLTIGPLHYEFRAHDDWGKDALARLQAHVVPVPFTGAPGRVLHLADLHMTPDENEEINQDRLPDRFAALLPGKGPRQGWRLTGDETGYLTFLHDQSRHSPFVFGTIPARCSGPFQLPWPALLEDITARGGGILHGGLIAQSGHGYIVTAPPGGGKTTMISRLPSEWCVYSDDACLVWPSDSGQFLASPLPTWSLLLGRSEVLPAIGRWRLGDREPIEAVLLLQIGNCDQWEAMSPRQVLLPLCRALSEHPRVVSNRDRYRTHLFDVARDLAKSAPAAKLSVPLDT